MQTIINEIENNKNFNGGGLATNITGKLESNRHAIARMTKVTFGEAVKELKKKKNGGVNITAKELLEIYRGVFGEPEWHHAGKLPKQYGGGMKKTYFLQKMPTAEEVKQWQAEFEIKNSAKLEAQEIERQKTRERENFIKKYGTCFRRLQEAPKYAVVLVTEMHGKYGWFEANYRYNLPEYYSGVAFKSKKSLEKYLSM
ncbi:hypothetical protein QP519_10535 [Weeksella virosa]|uniref:hypothetical protein n=1 Tax=Weeksella virosa TaxID=1014 RepID=UPI00255284FD|nr:hypothetical protein [Weeksella virosa]MDK7375970.1 hypothetical protein [Weeksella virosa]